MHHLLRKGTENYNLKVTYISYGNFCNKLLKNLKYAYKKRLPRLSLTLKPPGML